ncbi:hypothetical protein MJG53_017566 [Ovis ammon polii x Ovis aries]|uniref:Uncharacterized protein n=1 Tax=Ovis ammon polii x Ovis aries TaxID=2918886 RepID=A0ACB9U8L4_9CETA|nr:hypothetical protein MJG53_017566 [Ovis ammon polii x Ovis aries]
MMRPEEEKESKKKKALQLLVRGPAALEWDVASHQDFIHSQCTVLCLLLGYQVGILKPNSKHIHERKKLKKLPGIKSYKDLVFLSHGFPVLSFLDSMSWNGAFGSGTPDSAVQAGRTRAEKLNPQPYGFPKLVKIPEDEEPWGEISGEEGMRNEDVKPIELMIDLLEERKKGAIPEVTSRVQFEALTTWAHKREIIKSVCMEFKPLTYVYPPMGIITSVMGDENELWYFVLLTRKVPSCKDLMPLVFSHDTGRRHVWRTTLPPAPPFPDFSQRWGEEPVPSVRQPGARRPGDRCLVPSGGAGDDEGELLTDS